MRFHQMMQFQAQQTNAMLKMMAMVMNPAITPEQLSVFEVKAPDLAISKKFRRQSLLRFCNLLLLSMHFHLYLLSLCKVLSLLVLNLACFLLCYMYLLSHMHAHRTGAKQQHHFVSTNVTFLMQRTRIIWYYRREENVLRCPQG